MRRGRKPTRTKRMARGGVARKPARGRRTTTPMRGRSLGNTGAMMARKASPKRQSRGRRGKQMYQRGGGVRKLAHGGSMQNSQFKGGNPCPNSEFHPNNHYFFETAVNPSGVTNYYCCPTRSRTEKCNGYDKLANLHDLFHASIPRTIGG